MLTVYTPAFYRTVLPTANAAQNCLQHPSRIQTTDGVLMPIIGISNSTKYCLDRETSSPRTTCLVMSLPLEPTGYIVKWTSCCSQRPSTRV